MVFPASASKVFLTLFLMSSSIIFAQETRATLSGTVTDKSQSVLSNVRLQLMNVDTATIFKATSNSVGQYRFLFLNPGNYKLTAEIQGFRNFSRTGIVLDVSQAATVDITMAIGSQTETVQVTASEPQLETEKADRGLVVSQNNLAELPITTRNPIVLAELTPGVTNTGQSYNLTPFSNSGNSSFSVNGDTGDATENLLDGAPNDMIYQSLNSIAYVPSVDAVSEFKVITAPYDAQYGRNGGAVISVVTKNGTNAFHGTAYDFVERPFLNANSYANKAVGLPRSDSTLDQYGGTIGGPVRIPRLYNGTDKTFFFVAWEGYNQNINLSTVISVPTALQRQGDFSQTFNSSGKLITIYDPQSGHLVNNQWVRNPFPGNKIPVGRLDAVGAALAAAYPLPNTNLQSTVNWQNNYFPSSNITSYDFHNFDMRVDQNFSEKEKMYARYAWNNQSLSQNTNEVPGIAADNRNGTKINNDAVLDSITILTPNMVLDLRASLTRWVQNYAPTSFGGFDGTQIGLPQSLVRAFTEPHRFPYITATNYQTLGNSANNIWYAPTTTITLAPTLTIVHGRQSLKGGLDYRWTRFSTFQGAYGGGTFAISPAFTQSNYLTADSLSGNAIATMLLGGAATGEADSLPSPNYSWKYWAPWIQDDIKVTQRLTVNAGLRWDLQIPLIERHNELTRGFFPNAVNPISSQTGLSGYTVKGGIGFVEVGGTSRSPFNMDWNNIQPRVGAAFRLTPTTVIRGGWGVFYLPQFSTASSTGFSQATPFVSSLDGGKTQSSFLANPFPTGLIAPTGSSLGVATALGGNPSYSDPSGRIGHVQSFSFGFEKRLPAQITLDVAYVGTRSTALAVNGKNIDALSTANLALGNTDLRGNPNYLTAQVPNPFQGLLPNTSLNGATISRQQSLLLFPQFTGVTENDYPVGKSWYNSLQITYLQRAWHNLNVTGTYTFSKDIQAITFLNPQDLTPAHTAAPWDRTQRVVVAPVYELPFGHGQAFLNNENRVIDRIIGGWQTATVYTWQTGSPMTAPANVYIVGNPVLSNRSWAQMFNSGLIEANGTIADVVDGLPPAFRIQPAFSLRNVPLQLGNLRDRWGNEFQFTLAKNNRIKETMNLQFRAEFLNLFNHPIFGSDPIVNPTSPQFGQLIRSKGQSNIPRTIQLAVNFRF
ncbi:MAG: carboxypeptidase-like regulatory domain-containing protein [Edaphobacter sp.]